uniref:BTB domain-containing protein n=1 Tax=Panagrolaimus sp. ES5 TaxID=591445 RepID=A0AC34F8W0_9BILA
MSLFFDERVKEQKVDDRAKDKNIVFTFPWIFSFPIQNDGQWMTEGLIAESYMTTSYKMATIHWNVSLTDGYNYILVSNQNSQEYLKDGDCFISYTLFYDSQMRFEFFSSTRIQMEEYRENFRTPEGYMTRFIEGMNNNKFKKCVISVELHLPMKYFCQASFKRSYTDFDDNQISDKFPMDYENDFRFEFLRNGDYTFECLDGIVPAHRNILFSSSSTMKKQLSSPFHHTFGTVMFTVDVIKPIIIFLHSHCFKLPESFNFDYIFRLLKAIEFFEPVQKWDMITKIGEILGEKFVKENHDLNSLLLWLSFNCKCKKYGLGLSNMICSLIANEHYFKWLRMFPETARNADNHLYRETFGQMQLDRIFAYIDQIFGESFFTNIILQ